MQTNNLTGYPSIDKQHLKGLGYFERHPFIPNISIANALDLMYRFKGDLPVFDCLDLTVTHRQFKQDADTIAKAFVRMGVKPGDIVAISMPNLYQAVAAFRAANKIGAITTFLNPFASDEELLGYLNKYNSPVLLNYGKDAEYNRTLISKSMLRHIITLSPEKVCVCEFEALSVQQYEIPTLLSYHELGRIAAQHKGRVRCGFFGKQDALILYTSGSTGEPKSLLFTNENLFAAMLYLKKSTHQKKTAPQEKRWMSVVPFMYPYGFCCSVLATIFIDAQIILTPDLSQDTIAKYYEKKPYLVFGSPAFLELTKRNLTDDMDLSSLKVFVSGGDFLSASQSESGTRFFKKHGAEVQICNGSGNGETLGCSTNAMNIPYRPETVGQLVLGPDYVVLDPDTKQEVKYDEPGILCTRGKHVFKGYYNDPENTEKTMVTFRGKKYYYTGNYGMLGRDRYFTMIGRSSRFYITYTLNKVYCELVQNVISGIDIVDACAVVPKPDKENLFKSKAYVVLKQGVAEGKEAEQYIIRKSLEPYFDTASGENITLKPYEAPESVTFLDALPRTASAEKIDYELLRKMAEKESAAEYEHIDLNPKS